jgi:hypothetical protein
MYATHALDAFEHFEQQKKAAPANAA